MTHVIDRVQTREIPVELTRTELSRGKPKRQIRMAVGVIRAEDLRNNYVVPRRSSRDQKGYQREVSSSRVNRLIKDLKAGLVDLPTSVLVNIRDYDEAANLVKRDGRAYFVLNGQKLYVVDGQHRVEALSRLVDEDEERWGAFEIPFVCMLGADEEEEMKQFYVVNSTAKSVRTDLALDLLKQRAENEPELMEGLIERGEDWKVKAQELAEELAKTPVWRGRVRFPGDPSGETVISSAGVVSSLRRPLGTPYFGQISTTKQVEILSSYWRGIQRVIPEAFDEPAKYTIQKSVGVSIMHGVLVSVLEYVRSMGMSVIDPETYRETLEDVLLNLEGETSSGEIAKGAEFWLSGSEGAAGSYSSNAGQRVLIARLRGRLPDIEVD
jgi:DGQHR domain-containing protein